MKIKLPPKIIPKLSILHQTQSGPFQCNSYQRNYIHGCQPMRGVVSRRRGGGGGEGGVGGGGGSGGVVCQADAKTKFGLELINMRLLLMQSSADCSHIAVHQTHADQDSQVL